MKLAMIIGFVLFMMDPCHVEPRTLKVSEAEAMCASDHPTKYVKIAGRFKEKESIICGDMPGGVHCGLDLADESETFTARVLIKGGNSSIESPRRGSIAFNAPEDWDGIAPIEADFNTLVLFDSEGVRIDHLTEKLEISGTLRNDERSGNCVLQNIQRIKRVE